jgi:nucleotide-binding universal stress UspA family protein
MTFGPAEQDRQRGLIPERESRFSGVEGAGVTLTDRERLLAHRSWPDEGPWIVGVDGSDCSRAALEWAMANAPGRATAIHLVTAWQTPIYGLQSITGPIAVPSDEDGLASAARDDIGRLAAETQSRTDIPVEPIVMHGGAATALLEASAHGALVVVGTRGRGGFTRLLLGSTSNQCATHARVPTAVIPGRTQPGGAQRILVGLDGSPNSHAALHWALHFAAPRTTIDVTWVWDASALAAGADEHFFPDASESAEQRYDHLLDQVTRGLAGRGVTIERNFVRGRPRLTLATSAENVDLVVVGARGYGAVGAALLGSVTSWMLHHVERPIVVVPDGADEPVTV